MALKIFTTIEPTSDRFSINASRALIVVTFALVKYAFARYASCTYTTPLLAESTLPVPLKVTTPATATLLPIVALVLTVA